MLSLFARFGQRSLENMDLSDAFQGKIHLFYLKEDYRGVINVSQSLTHILEKLKQSSIQIHIWTSYRIAYSYEQLASSMACHSIKKRSI